MRLLMRIPEAEMVAVFLRAEIDSPRFQQAILGLLAHQAIDRQLIDTPNTDDHQENEQRARILAAFRGYRRNADVFTDLPDDVGWYRATFDWPDLERLKYINDPYWTAFSGGSRFVQDAVRRLRAGAIDPNEAACYWALAAALDRGLIVPEPILLHNPASHETVILEGHIRMTASMLRTRVPGAELRAIVGCSPRIRK